MTSITPTSADDLSQDRQESAKAPRQSWLGRAWDAVVAVADRANPILVKETRQALKSRQFVVVFLIVLIACWIASFMVVAIVGPEVYFVAAGAQMLLVYAIILSFPLMLIVPYTAFRSLAAEQEDNTYDLLSITTLSTAQIITGKLTSAIVQMLVYLSAVSPCIAFTFLLRGVDALTVVVLLGYLVLTSLALSMISLLMGTLVRVKYTQVLVSVLLVLGLFGCFSLSIGLMTEFISDSYYYLRETWFWVANMAFLTLYVTTFALLHAAASAQIAFSSENRSTPLRRIMLIQQACFIGWMSLIVVFGDNDPLNMVMFRIAVCSGIYWYGMGTLLTSEWPHLSRRVQRSLPQSQLGRIFLTWQNPGPGTGLMLSVSNLTLIALAGVLLVKIHPTVMPGGPNSDQLFFFYTIGWSYLVFYLGLGKLLISLARRFAFVSLTAGFLLHIILLLVGCGGPQIMAFMSSSTQFGNQYSLLHITNPLWTLIELVNNGSAAIDAWTVLLLVGSAAIIVLLLNLSAVATEIQHHRRNLPQRVAEDEAILHPEPETGPTNPWEAEGE
ncbi:MAG: hypothetical protein AAGD11_02570 [Planctomycetota bacterium]